MDAIDRKILAVLQKDASLSVAEIGNRVGLSSTPCWKRIQRLEAEGVIQRRVAVLDQDKLGLGVTVFVSVETGDHSEQWLKTFATAVGAMPEVMEFYRMAGDVDYMLRVVVKDIAGYDEFYKRLIAAIPALSPYPAWVGEFIDGVRERYNPLADDDDGGEEKPSPEAASPGEHTDD